MPDDDSARIELNEGELLLTRSGTASASFSVEILDSSWGSAWGRSTERFSVTAHQTWRSRFSPSDSVAQLTRKVKQYFAAGCHTMWMIYANRREVHVLEAGGEDRLLTAEDTLEATELLPGFSASVASLFQ